MGSNTLDVFVTTEAELATITIHEKGRKKTREKCIAYPLGAKILIKDVDFEIGGGGTNTAVSFSRLGLRTGYLGRIGHDNNGMQVYSLLHREKVEFLGTFGKRTGYSVILDSQAEDRTILTFKGCNDEFSLGGVKLGRLKTKWFYFSSMTNGGLKALKKLALYAAKKKIRVAFNPSRYLVEGGVRALRDILRNTNVLVLNRDEAEILTGKTGTDNLLRALKRYAKDYAVITDGKNGCWCYDGSRVLCAAPRKNLKIVETTGAGDAFASAFTAALLCGSDAEAAVRRGMLQAESVIQYKGAKNVLLTRKQMDAALKRDRRPVKTKTLK